MESLLILLAFFIIGGGITTAIVMTHEIKKHRPIKTASNANQYIQASDTQITKKEDTFLKPNSTRIKIQSSK